MKIVKYDSAKTTQSSAGGGSSGGGSSTTIQGGSASLDRVIWGKKDTGEDIDGTITVNGDVNIKVIDPLSDEGDDEDDGSGEYEDYEEGGGNLNVELKTTTNDLEVNEDAYIHRHLYINYPSHPDHSDSKKCIGEILKSVEDKVNSLMPIGSIIMYNGLVENIPNGWHICDGTNGTPNLTDKFIKASNVCGITGGNSSITLTSDNLPFHTHTATALSTLSNSNIPESYDNKLVQALDELYENPFDLGGDDHYVVETGYHNKSDKGLVGIKVSDLKTGTVNTEVTVNGTGVTETSSIDIQPPYYSLIFIMKIS